MATHSREGEVLAGKYRLEQLLGKGAVGLIYRAQNMLIGRTVAIKLMRPEHATDDDVVRRFMREARAANLVRHPNVVDVLDVGQDEFGVPFMVEEFLEGEDLARHVQHKGGQLSTQQTLELLIPVAEAVGYAHSRGVVHRDLKPENVFLARCEGKIVPKLLDFGLSRIKIAPGEIRATATGMTMGSPAYMSPEQIEGSKDLDARADVWALGVILFEVLSGQLPFRGDSHVAVFVQITWADPPQLEQLAPTVPRDLARVVSRCLRRAADQRYPSAAELARDLRLVREGANIEPTMRHSIPVPPPSMNQPAGPSLQRPFAVTRLADPGPSAARPARSPGNPSEHNLLDFSDADRSQPAASSGLAIATLRPPPPSRELASALDAASHGEIDVSSFWGLMALVAVASATGALLMVLLHTPGGWPVLQWAPAWFDGSSPLHSAVAVAALAGAGSWLGAHAIRKNPKGWALLAAAAALVLAGLSLVTRLAGFPAVMPAAIWVGWGLALGAGGIGLHAFREAWACWRTRDKARALLLAAAATGALFVAGELLRAVL